MESVPISVSRLVYTACRSVVSSRGDWVPLLGDAGRMAEWTCCWMKDLLGQLGELQGKLLGLLVRETCNSLLGLATVGCPGFDAARDDQEDGNESYQRQHCWELELDAKSAPNQTLNPTSINGKMQDKCVHFAVDLVPTHSCIGAMPVSGMPFSKESQGLLASGVLDRLLFSRMLATEIDPSEVPWQCHPAHFLHGPD